LIDDIYILSIIYNNKSETIPIKILE
jgi:hypothetical protein